MSFDRRRMVMKALIESQVNYCFNMDVSFKNIEQ